MHSIFLRRLLPLLALASPLHAQLSREQVEQTKGAMALLIREDRSTTAFCLSEDGLFAACIADPRALPRKDSSFQIKPITDLTIVVDPRGPKEKRYPARLITDDSDHDLAILKIDPVGKLPVAILGDSAKLKLDQPLFVFGYPSWQPKSGAREFPTVGVKTVGLVTLGKTSARSNTVQLTDKLEPGFAGGPMLDATGQIVAVLSTTPARDTGSNTAIPISVLKATISAPIIALPRPEIPWEKRLQPYDFVVGVKWVKPPAEEPEVIVQIREGRKTRQTVAKKRPDGSYVGTIAPVGPKTPTISIKTPRTNLGGEVDDFPIMIDGQPKLLSDIRVIEAAPGGGFLVDGKPAGPLPEIAQIKIPQANEDLIFDGHTATKIHIQESDSIHETVQISVLIRGYAGKASHTGQGTRFNILPPPLAR